MLERVIPDLDAPRHADVRRRRALGARGRHQGDQDLVLRPRPRRSLDDGARRGAARGTTRSILPVLIRVEVDPRARRAVAAAGRRAARGARSGLPRVGRRPHPVRRAYDVRRAARSASSPRPRRQRGIALILVLWLTIMLTVIASGFAFSMRSEALSARNALSLAQARTAADGAIERMAFELSRPRYPAAWTRRRAAAHVDATATSTLVGVRGRRVRARSTSTRRPRRCCKGLIEHVGGADPDVAGAHRRRDPRLARPGRPASVPTAPRTPTTVRPASSRSPPTRRSRRCGELSRVLGMTPAIFARIADSLTVNSRQPGINADDRVARRAARAAQRHAGARRHLPAAARRRAGGEAAGAAVSAGRGLRGRRGAGLAHPRRGARCPMV